MKIYCDYCGAQIETTIHKCCPNCGGSYQGDSEIREAQARQKKLDDLDVTQKELETERMKLENERCKQKTLSDKQTSSFGRLVKFVLVGLFIVFAIYAIYRAGKMADRAESLQNQNAAVSIAEIVQSGSTDFGIL